jgi:hypothetical protein
LSSATATGGNASFGIDGVFHGGDDVNAVANASAGGGGKAIATAVATVGEVRSFDQRSAQATANAETVNGAEAQAVTTALAAPAEFSSVSVSASSTAQTRFAGVTTIATAISQGNDANISATTEAIAQGARVRLCQPRT